MKSNWRERRDVEQTLSRRKVDNYVDLLHVVLDTNPNLKIHSSKISGYLRSRRFDLLLEFADSLGRTEYATASEHFEASQLAALIKKIPFDCRAFGIDPKRAALDKFFAAERRCRRYNLIFSLEIKLKRRRASFLRDEMRSWIRRVIGESPNYAKIWPLCDFGPGASVGVSGNVTHLARKLLSENWSVTPSAQQYALAAMRSNPHFWEILLNKENSPNFSWDPEKFSQEFMSKCKLVDYNKIALVPKTAKVHRTIAVEPLLNGFVQKGVESFLKKRLSRYGIDLTNQSRNQELARQGSIQENDAYSTIDLSEASDSISIALAKDLLPRDWFTFLSALRSPSYLLNGVAKPYEKFCSMGNGFCFPLETLIFSSVCEAVYKSHDRMADYSVYGDDIIVRSSLADEVLKLLYLLGFRHNPKKTFLRGPFRESCGADWFRGEDVRPTTLDTFFLTMGDVFSFHNQTLRSDRTTVFFQETRDFLRALIPPKYRFLRPYKGNSDTAFEVELDLFMNSPFARWNRETFSWGWKELVPYTPYDRSMSDRAGFPAVLLIAALRGSSSEAPFTARRNTRTRVTQIDRSPGWATSLPPSGDRRVSPRWLLSSLLTVRRRDIPSTASPTIPS